MRSEREESRDEELPHEVLKGLEDVKVGCLEEEIGVRWGAKQGETVTMFG